LRWKKLTQRAKGCLIECRGMVSKGKVSSQNAAHPLSRQSTEFSLGNEPLLTVYRMELSISNSEFSILNGGLSLGELRGEYNSSRYTVSIWKGLCKEREYFSTKHLKSETALHYASGADSRK